MKKFKKLVSGVVSSCMVFSCLSMPAFAANQEPLQEVNLSDEIVYQVMDARTQEVTTTYQSDIDAGHWNVAALGEDSPVIFEEFPMRSTSSVNDYAELTVTFEYLKTLLDNDSATFTVTNRQTNEEYLFADLKDNHLVELANLPVGNTYTVTLTETFDGESVTYARVMEIENKCASMPKNVSLTAVGETEGVQATVVEVTEMNKADMESYITEDGREITVLKERASATITPAELPAYYQTLPANRLYKVSASSGDDYARTFSGFISTYPGDDGYGIYEPGFSLIKEEDYNDSGIATFSLAQPASLSSRAFFTKDEIIDNANNYTNMFDAEITVAEDDPVGFFVVKFPSDAFTSYQYEFISTELMHVEVWMGGENEDPSYAWQETIGTTVTNSYELALNQYVYFGIMFLNTDSGTALFRIKATDYADQSNSYYDLKAAGTRQANEVLINECIDYRGDVDVYYVDNTAGAGMYPADITTGASNNKELTVKFLREGNRIGGGTIMVTDYTFTVNAGQLQTIIPTLSANTNYFIQIHSKTAVYNTVGDSYSMIINTPFTPDPKESNNTPATATELTGMDSLRDVYLHKGDVDYYTFDVTGEQKFLYCSIYRTNLTIYNLTLLNSDMETVATGTIDGSYNIIDNFPLDPGTYYIKIDYAGLGDEAYFILDSYRLNVEVMTASVEMKNAVGLTYTAGQSVNIANYLTTVLAAADCEIGGYDYTASDKVDHCALFIMNNSNKLAMTAENLASLPNGTYSVTLEFFGIEATGESITLAVTGSSVAAGTIVELTTVTMENTTNVNWYWAACAKMIANSRLTREGSPVSLLSLPAAINGAFGASYLSKIGTIEETAQLASYFYNGNKDGYSFINSEISMNGIENSILAELNAGKAILAKLSSSDNATVKYIIIYGINTGTHQYKIMDPEGAVNTWIDADELYSGYGGNTSLTFSGQVIECL